MKKELLLLRHGKSDWDTTTNDFNRPLKKRGVQAAKKQGAELRCYYSNSVAGVYDSDLDILLRSGWIMRLQQANWCK